MKYDIYHGETNGQIELEVAPPLDKLAIVGIASRLVQSERLLNWGGKPLGSLDVTRQDSDGTVLIAELSQYSGHIHTPAEIAEKIGHLMDPFGRHEINIVP